MRRLLLVGVLTCSLAACGSAPSPEPALVTVVAPLAPLSVLTSAIGLGPVAATATVGMALSPLDLATPRELPRGGRSIFPTYEVVAHYGTATTAVLGVLGEGTPDQAGRNLLAAAEPFGKASGRRILPAFELIVSVAQRSPGDDGDYSAYIPDADIERYLAAARRIKALVLLDLQPGLADPLAQAQHFEKFLREPDVGLALDPEWKLYGDQKPGRQIGTLDAASVNRVSAWLGELTARLDLPEKLFVLHQFQQRMLPDRDAIVVRPGLATVVHVDGFGTRGGKLETYAAVADTTGRLRNGFKLFLDEDVDLMSPAEVMALTPQPDLITYQ